MRDTDPGPAAAHTGFVTNIGLVERTLVPVGDTGPGVAYTGFVACIGPVERSRLAAVGIPLRSAAGGSIQSGLGCPGCMAGLPADPTSYRMLEEGIATKLEGRENFRVGLLEIRQLGDRQASHSGYTLARLACSRRTHWCECSHSMHSCAERSTLVSNLLADHQSAEEHLEGGHSC